MHVDDLAILYAEFGVEVTGEDGATAKAYYEQPGVTTRDGMGIANDYAIELLASELPAAKRGYGITVAGVAFVVGEVFSICGGAEKRLTLRKV